MSGLYELRTAADRSVQVLAEDEIEAIETAGPLLEDGDEGTVEQIATPDVEPYEPEGPG